MILRLHYKFLNRVLTVMTFMTVQQLSRKNKKYEKNNKLKIILNIAKEYFYLLWHYSLLKILLFSHNWLSVFLYLFCFYHLFATFQCW